QTPSAGLNYALRVGTTPGGSDIVNPESFIHPPDSPADGLRKVAAIGLVQTTSWTLTGLTPGKNYYWSVQAIDTALAGGPFAAEATFNPAPFTDSGIVLPGVAGSSVAWGDYDNDGKLDFLLTGAVGGGNYLSKVYHNEGNGSFSDSAIALTDVVH